MIPPVIVIYHRADFDGIFSREIAKRFYGDNASYLGWDYGDPLPVLPPDALVYMIDISIDGLMDHPNLVWIDHHKSAIEKFRGDIPGYRIDGVAACRLAWQYFFGAEGPVSVTRHFNDSRLPGRADYVNRLVEEPLAVRLAGEYDIWDKRDPRADLFQHGLRSQALNFPLLLTQEAGPYVEQLLKAAEVIQYVQREQDKSVITRQGFTLQFEGLTFLACNSARYNSHLFAAGLKPEHDGCLGFKWDGVKQKWSVSMYGAPGKLDIDFSAIAVRYGGGGHKQACGFECSVLPFTLECNIVKSGVALIARERERQITQENWSAGHDDEHDEGELARAAACYAMPEFVRKFPTSLGTYRSNVWPWEDQSWKPTPGDRVRELINAGALIAAEIDRLQRLSGGAS